jgi:deazaflavin-dependent oxidoreductase (nitroreductase family)
MGLPANVATRSTRSTRQVAFVAEAAILSLLVGVTFAGVTVLTIGLWLAHRNPDTTPVTDLGFFALGFIIIGGGLASQLWAPERHVAGVQQVVLALLALGVAGLIGDRIEPLVGSLAFLLATAVLFALHPARGEVLRLGNRLSALLAVMAVLAAIPAVGYAAGMLGLARQAGPSCFLGRCARGDRLAEMAALALAIALVGTLAAWKPPGWRLSAWCAGTSSIVVGLASIALPDAPGAVGQAGGAFVVAWGVLFVAAAEWEATRTASDVFHSRPSSDARAAKEDQMTAIRPYMRPDAVMRRLINPLMVRLRIGTTLVVPGRRTGKLIETPLVPLELDGERYLVSGGGNTQWARNLRAAGRATLRTDGRAEEFRAVELGGAERDRIVAAYRQKLGHRVDRYFDQLPDAADHAAFRVEPIKQEAVR